MNSFQREKNAFATQADDIRAARTALRGSTVTRQGFVTAMRAAGAFEAEIIDALSEDTDAEFEAALRLRSSGAGEMTTAEAWAIVGNQPEWAIKNTVRALYVLGALNTAEENQRLEAALICLRTKNPRYSS